MGIPILILVTTEHKILTLFYSIVMSFPSNSTCHLAPIPVQHIDRKELYTSLPARVRYLHSFLGFNAGRPLFR